MKEIYLIFLALIGFSVSAYLYYFKTHDKKIYCFIGHDCDEVVKSKYGKTFGIENTVPGMMYYLLIFAYSAAFLLNRNIFKDTFIYYSIVGASVASVLFSIYLVFVQAFALRKWCEYCVISTIASILILLVLVL